MCIRDSIWIYQAYIQGNNAICPYTSEILHIGRETFFLSLIHIYSVVYEGWVADAKLQDGLLACIRQRHKTEPLFMLSLIHI